MYGLCKSCTFNVYVSHEFCLWSLFASPWVRVSCGGPRGASPWARVISAGLCDYEQAYWSQTCRRSRSVGAEPGRVLPVPAGGCRVGRCRVFPWTRAVCCTCGHVDAPNDMFIFLFFIMSHYIYTQRVYYICMSYYISTQRFYYICSFYDILVHIGTVYSCTICGRILALG